MGAYPSAAAQLKVPPPPENPVEQYGRLLQLKGMAGQQQLQQQAIQSGQLQNQQEQIKTAELQRQQSDQAAIRQLLADPSNKGKTIGQVADIAAQNNAISPQAWQSYKKADIEARKEAAGLDETTLKNRKAAQDEKQTLFNNVMNLPDDQVTANWPQIAQQYNAIPGNEKQPLDPNKPVPKQQLANFGPMIGLGNAYFDQELERRKKTAETAGSEADSAAKVRANTATQLAAAFKSGPDAYTAARAELPFKIASQFPDKPASPDDILQSGMTPHEQASVPVEKIEMKDWLAKNPGKSPSDFMRYQKTIVPAFNFNLQTGGAAAPGTPVADVAKKFGMSQAAFDQASEKYFQTGTLPPIGRGMAGPALNKSIMNRTAELHPEGSLAENASAFKANSDSLKKLQGQRDAVVAFENTAGKNLDLFLNQAQKVVDSGSPWINRPLRTISQAALGSADLAAYNTARQVAINEIAKVTSNPGMSGTLSDSARHEVENFNPASATLRQTLAVAKVLKQDMSNRRVSYDDQIADIQGRMKTQPSGGAAGQPANDVADPFAEFGGQKIKK